MFITRHGTCISGQMQLVSPAPSAFWSDSGQWTLSCITRRYASFARSIYRATSMQKMFAMLGALALSASNIAAGLDGKQIAKSRDEHFHTLGKAAKSLTDELAQSSPNWRIVGDEAGAIERLAAQLPYWFPAGSDPASGVKTSAREAVWTKPQEFKQAADSFAIEAAKMTQLAPAAGIAASRAQNKMLTETCGTCHRNFRSKW